MSEMRSGNLIIRTKNNKVEFEVVGKSCSCAHIDPSELPIIVQFLNTYFYSQSDHRTAFRIDLSRLKQDISKHFRVFVETTDRQVAVKPIDVSVAGIYVETEQVIGKVGAKVNVSLSYDNKTIVLQAIVVRQSITSTHTALHFIDAGREGVFGPPSRLDFIFRELETLWLGSCLNLVWCNQEPLEQK